MRISLALAAAMAAVAVALGFVLADAEQRQAGSNYVHDDDDSNDPTVPLGPDGHCEKAQTVPGDTAALRLLVGTFGRPPPPVAVSVRAEGSSVSSGRRLAGGARAAESQHLVIPLQRVERTTSGATVCVRTLGPGDPETVLYGTPGQVRFEWLRGGHESWLELMPTLVHRFSLGKANPFGDWLLPLTALVLLLGWAAALRILVRELAS